MNMQLQHQLQIDKKSPIPLYYQLKSQLLELFANGYYKAGDKLPTEIELCELLDISRPTVRQAFSELIVEGYITRLKAKGTFVAQPKVEGFFFQKLNSFDEEMKSLGFVPSTKVLAQEIIPTPKEITSIFNCEKVLHLKRLRYADKKEMVVVDTYVPYALFEGIEHVNFTKESLYHVFEEKYQCSIAYVDRIVEIQKASQAVIEALHLQMDSSILYVSSTAYTVEDVPIEYSHASYHGDRNQFKMRLLKQD